MIWRYRQVPRRCDLPQPQVWRAPELLHGLGNIIENAADFATQVRIQAGGMRAVCGSRSRMTGRASRPEIFERIGEPM